MFAALGILENMIEVKQEVAEALVEKTKVGGRERRLGGWVGKCEGHCGCSQNRRRRRWWWRRPRRAGAGRDGWWGWYGWGWRGRAGGWLTD